MNKALYFITIFVASSVFAGGGHFHPKKVASCKSICSKDEIKDATFRGVQELAKWNKIDKNWMNSKIESIVKKTFTKKDKALEAWVVTLSKSGDIQYIYFTTHGKIFRTNKTGELK